MKVLIVDEMHQSIVDMPEELGLEVDYFPNIDFEEVLQKVGEYEGLIIRSKFKIDRTFLHAAKKLKFIARAGAGLDLIDVQACKNVNVTVFGANEGNRVAVAEHLIGMILSLLHKINKSSKEVKKGLWLREENRGEELSSKTIGIIGYGNNGQVTAERLSAFGCRVMAFDKYRKGFGNDRIEECGLETIFENCDILSLHIPLSEETEQWINAEFFNQFKKDIYFCNIARGEIVVLKDLVNAMKSGKIKGVCLDVLENEKFTTFTELESENFKYLSSRDNVILSPHIAGWSNESYIKISEVLKEKITQFLKPNQNHIMSEK